MLFIGEFILERNHINVMYVGRPLIKLQTIQFVREFILERNLTNVMNVTKLLIGAQGLLSIRKFTWARPLNFTNVYKCE